SDKQRPQQVSRVSPGDTYDLRVVEPYAYVSDFYQGLEVYDIHDPTRPMLVTRFAAGGNPVAIRVLHRTAYLAATFGGLRLVGLRLRAAPGRSRWLVRWPMSWGMIG